MVDFIAQIIKFGKKLATYELVQASSGNISIKIDDGLLITKTGAILDELSEDDIVNVGLYNSSSLDKVASSELDLHRKIYLYNPSLSAIIHAHPLFGVVLSFSKKSFIPVDKAGKIFLSQIPILEDIDKKSEFVEIVASKFRHCKGLLIKGHGSVAAGKTLEEAYLITSFIENSCKIRYFLNSKRPQEG